MKKTFPDLCTKEQVEFDGLTAFVLYHDHKMERYSCYVYGYPIGDDISHTFHTQLLIIPTQEIKPTQVGHAFVLVHIDDYSNYSERYDQDSVSVSCELGNGENMEVENRYYYEKYPQQDHDRKSPLGSLLNYSAIKWDIMILMNSASQIGFQRCAPASPTEFFYIYGRNIIMDSHLRDIVGGRASKKIQGIYLLCTFTYYATFLAICILLFEGGSWGDSSYGSFSFLHTAISNLGNPNLNPHAWWVFSIGMIGTGILLSPSICYLYFHIRSDAPKSAKIIVLCLSLTPIGMIGAGIINENLFFVVHYIFGALVYAGLGLAAIYTFFFFLLRLFRRKSWPLLWEFVILYGIVLIALGFLIFQLTAQPGLDEIDLSEWLMLVALLSWLVGIYLILPTSTVEEKKAK